MRARALIPILTLLLTAPALGGAGDADAARRRGLEAMARNDWPAAARELAAAADAFSRDGRVVELAATLEELGTVQLSGLGDPAAALATFERGAAIAERPASAWLWAALAAEQSGRPELARVYKQRALGGAAAKPASELAGGSPVPAAASETSAAPSASASARSPSPTAAIAPAEKAPPIAPPANAASAPAAQSAPTVPTAPAVSGPYAAAPEPTPFAHFFGALAEPAPTPAAPPASGATERPAAESPTPFGRFFGPQVGSAPSGTPGAEAPPATPPAASPPSAKADAFQYFFGAKQKPAPKSDEKSAAPTPPAQPPPPPPSTRR